MTAIYYVFMDITIIIQFFYYSIKQRQTVQNEVISAAAIVGFYGNTGRQNTI